MRLRWTLTVFALTRRRGPTRVVSTLARTWHARTGLPPYPIVDERARSATVRADNRRGPRRNADHTFPPHAANAYAGAAKAREEHSGHHTKDR